MPIANETDLARLLADESITVISVDTNIFDEKGLQLNSAVLQAIAGLKDGRFAFILSGTVARELIRHLEAKTQEALRSARKAIGSALSAFETEQPTREDLLAQISRGRTANEAADERLKAYIAATECEVLDDAALVETSTIYAAYFEAKPPFGTGLKKCEFPDALALNALERAAVNRQTGIIVVSKDKDWHAFCELSHRLYLLPEIERAIALINNAPVVVKKVAQTWLSKENEGREEVRARLQNEVERIEFSCDGFASSGEMEAIPWAGELVDINWPSEDEIDVISITAVDDEGTQNIILSLPLQIAAFVPVELNFSFWDSVDRESIGMGGRTIDVNALLDVRVTLTIDVNDLGSEDERVELVDLELDPLSHEIDLGMVDVFEPEDEELEDH